MGHTTQQLSCLGASSEDRKRWKFSAGCSVWCKTAVWLENLTMQESIGIKGKSPSRNFITSSGMQKSASKGIKQKKENLSFGNEHLLICNIKMLTLWKKTPSRWSTSKLASLMPVMQMAKSTSNPRCSSFLPGRKLWWRQSFSGSKFSWSDRLWAPIRFAVLEIGIELQALIIVNFVVRLHAVQSWRLGLSCFVALENVVCKAACYLYHAKAEPICI